MVFADYIGFVFSVAHVGTLKRARAVAREEAERRNAGHRLTMRIYKQIEHVRINKAGEKV